MLSKLRRSPIPRRPERASSALRIVLEDVERLEERRAGRDLAPALDLGERAVLEVLPFELAFLEALQPGGEKLGVFHPCPHRQGVDEHADHGLDTGQRGRTPGDRAAEDHVLLAAIAADEQGPGAQGDGLESQLVPRRQGLEPRRELAGELGFLLGVLRGSAPAWWSRPRGVGEVKPASSRRQNGSACAVSCSASQAM